LPLPIRLPAVSWSIRRALTFIVLASVLPAMAVLTVTGVEHLRRVQEDALELAQGLARGLAALHEGVAGESRVMLSALARTRMVKDGDNADCNGVFAGILQDKPELTNVLMTDAAGRVVASGLPPFLGTDVSDRKYFRDAMASGEFSAGDYIHGRTSGLPIQVFALPLTGPDGRPRGIIAMSYQLNMYEKFLESYPLPPSARVAFIDSKGVRMLAYPAGSDRPPGKPVAAGMWERTKSFPGDEGWFDGERMDGEPGLFVFSRLRLADGAEPFVTVVVSFSDKDIRGEAGRLLVRNVSLTCVAAALALLFSMLLGKYAILRDVTGLMDAASRLGAGDLDARADPGRGCTEIRDLSSRFNAMADALAERQQQLARSTRELASIRNMLSNILESMPSAVIGLDRQERITHWNRGAVLLTGIGASEALGRPLGEVFPWLSSQVDHVERKGREVDPLQMVGHAFPEGGETRFVDILAYPLVSNGVDGAVVRVDDVTSRVRLEALLVQSEKMSSIGSLAGGMAHEINNPLSGILQSVQVILRRLSPDVESNRQTAAECGLGLEALQAYLRRRGVLQFLDTIREAGERAAKLVRNMLGFIRKSSSARIPVSLPEIVDRAVEIAGTDYDLKKKYDFRSVEIVREYAPDMPPVASSPTDLEQVVYNLLVNAAQAMASPDMPPRRPRIVLRVYAEGPLGVLEVEDNGPGMEELVRDRIFEPLFSTKEPGEGTGLGLAVVWFIVVNSYGGDIRVESSPGMGARFVARLPLAAPGLPGEAANSAG